MNEEHFSGFRNNLGALRILLAAAVVFSNSFLLGVGVTDADPLKRFNHKQAITGHTAVDLFFIMSGFLAADSLLRNAQLGHFFWHRIRRVYPGFILAALFSFLIVLPLGGGEITGTAWLGDFGDLVYRTLRLAQPTYAGAFRHNPYPGDVNQSVWSISYGFWCYGLAALLCVMGALRSPRVLAALLTAATVVSVWFQTTAYFPRPHLALATVGYPAMWARILPMFLAGLLLRSVRPRLPVDVRLAGLAVGAIVIAAQIPHARSAVFPFAGAYLLYYVAFQRKLRLWRATALGDPSYGMYLLSFPIQQLLMRHATHGAAGQTLSPYLLFALSLPPSLVGGYLSWHLVERWFLPRVPGAMSEAGSVEKDELKRAV